MKLKNILLPACLALMLPVAQAAPVISSVDSSQMGAGVLTLSGSNFGPGAHIELFDRFESDTASDGSPIPLTSPEIGSWTSTNVPLLYYSGETHNGRFSAKAGARIFRHDFTQDVIQEVFASYWVRVPNGWNFPGADRPGVFPAASSWKFAWLIDQDYQGNSSDMVMVAHFGDGGFCIAGNDFNLETRLGNAWWSWNTWVRVAVWLRANPTNPTSPGDVLFQTVSEEKGVAENWMNRAVFDADGPALKQWQYMTLPGWVRSGEPLYDDVYVAAGPNAIARVELADSPDYAQAHRVAVQPASSWSDSSITVDVNQGGFSSLDNVYLFVWDKDGNRNATGFPVSGVTVAPPMYPSNIH